MHAATTPVSTRFRTNGRNMTVVEGPEMPDLKVWYDVMQVCVNGHQISAFAKSQPQSRQDFCQNCGAQTIDACPSCTMEIRGHRHSGADMFRAPEGPPIPKYCIGCGAVYPWQQSSIDNLKEILQESELSAQDVEIIETALPDVLQETPKTEGSSLRVKRANTAGRREAMIDCPHWPPISSPARSM